jgi:hypothetical protein
MSNTEKKMTPDQRGYGTLMFAVMVAMLGTGIAWASGLGLLPGLGWGLIGCVAGLLAGMVVYFVIMD